LTIQIQRKGLRFSIRLTVVGVFALATTLTAIIAIGLQYHFSRAMAVETAVARYKNHAENTRNYLSGIDNNAFHITRILAKHPQLLTKIDSPQETLSLFSEIMASNQLFYAIYLGYEDGDFFEVVNLNSSNTARRQLKAMPSDRWMVIRVEGEGTERKRHYEYYNDQFQLRLTHSERSDFDPRIRPWYSNASMTNVYKTRPYLFQHLQAPGQSYSMRLAGTNTVLAVDITLSSLSSFFNSQSYDNKSEIFLFQPSGELISSSHTRTDIETLPTAPAVTLSSQEQEFIQSIGTLRVSNELDWPPIDYAVSAQPQGYSVDVLKMISTMTGLKLEFVNGFSWEELVNLFNDGNLDILQPVFLSDQNIGQASNSFLTVNYAAATRQGQSAITQISDLEDRTIAIPASWSIISVLRQHYPSINVLEVDSPRDALEAVLNGEAFASLDASPILHYTADHYYLSDLQFHELTNNEKDQLPNQLHFLINDQYPLLLSIINKALANIQSQQTQQLRQKWFTTAEHQASIKHQTTIPYRELLSADTGILNQLHEVSIQGSQRFVYKSALNPEDPDSELFAVVTQRKDLLGPSLNRVKLSVAITTTCLLVLLPFIWLFAAPIVGPIKRLAIENHRIKNRRFDEVEFHDSAIVEIFELSHSMVDMAQTIKQHEEAQKALMESLIQLIAQAIDEKSPYTAGHCARVPELALMIAKAAEDSDEGPFKDFRFRNEDEYREFRIAAWLHDCGKITTPEHIVDKGVKLETIYNRIHEIRMRFEVLWRDAEIQYLNALIQDPTQEAALRDQLEDKRHRLQEDFAFIAQLNQGSEFMDEEQQSRLLSIALTTWQRHFDDRLGLSPMERQRHPDSEPQLPVTETLLADKPEHLIEHKKPKHFADHLHIKMEAPEHLYNLGELYNLSISRGTLSREDRFKIQEHMIGTIRMLDALPFPPELSNVPRYASTHHETLKGTGYPRQLNGDDLSIPERIMAVADIFEALTAADRPYKPAKTVSESIAILFRMVEDGDIDRDVVELFIRSGVYREYATRYLRPDQLDHIAENNYLRSAQTG